MTTKVDPTDENPPKPPRASTDLVTVHDLKETSKKEQTSINVTTLIATGSAVLVLIGTLLGGGYAFLGQARAEAHQTAKETAESVVAPLVPRVVFLESLTPFVVGEARATREEFRAFAQKGPAASELYRPMTPLPVVPDGGSVVH